MRRRAFTAPANRVSKQTLREVKPLRFPVAVKENSKQRRISLKISKSDQQNSMNDAWSSSRTTYKETIPEATLNSPHKNAAKKVRNECDVVANYLEVDKRVLQFYIVLEANYSM